VGVASARVDEPQLAAWGEAFARTLTRPAVIGLSGELGSGKTTLVRAIARGLGVQDLVTSPTFALVHRYEAAGRSVWHVDAYRIRREAEAGDLGFDEILADPGAVLLIEWPEKLGAAAPDLTHRIRLAYAGDDRVRLLEWNEGLVSDGR
jgi:tRNA threonylcarbamoyladenosine biosynthesis protein TsaE